MEPSEDGVAGGGAPVIQGAVDRFGCGPAGQSAARHVVTLPEHRPVTVV